MWCFITLPGFFLLEACFFSITCECKVFKKISNFNFFIIVAAFEERDGIFGLEVVFHQIIFNFLPSSSSQKFFLYIPKVIGVLSLLWEYILHAIIFRKTMGAQRLTWGKD